MLLVERPLEGVAIVVLNRPEAMNALSKALRAQLHDTLKSLDGDPQIRAIVLTGAGERAFTAGLDLKELGSDPNGMSAANATDPAENPARAVLACRKPVIAASSRPSGPASPTPTPASASPPAGGCRRSCRG